MNTQFFEQMKFLLLLIIAFLQVHSQTSYYYHTGIGCFRPVCYAYTPCTLPSGSPGQCCVPTDYAFYYYYTDKDTKRTRNDFFSFGQNEAAFNAYCQYPVVGWATCTNKWCTPFLLQNQMSAFYSCIMECNRQNPLPDNMLRDVATKTYGCKVWGWC